MIIGLTGTKASGKGVVSKVLETRGFAYSSLSDRVREEAGRRGLNNYTTNNLQDIGNELREKEGLGTLSKRTLSIPEIKEARNVVIDGIRNPGEINVFKEYDERGFYLVAVDAPQETRFKRLMGRGRASDPKKWDEFLVMDKRDIGNEEVESGQQVGKCMEMANYFFWQDFEKIEEANKYFTDGKKGFMNLFPEFSRMEKKRRPSFDEIFMRQAYEFGLRSTCLRRQVGAVIAKNNILISQGYNGPPRGLPHCEERGGCIRTQRNIPSGERAELCRASHAEINAIINAGRTGRSVVGAILYVTNFPCSYCAKDIIQALTPADEETGMARLIYLGQYNDPLAKELLLESKIQVEVFSGVTPAAFPRFWG